MAGAATQGRQDVYLRLKFFPLFYFPFIFSLFLPALEGSPISSRRTREDPETGPDREEARRVFA